MDGSLACPAARLTSGIGGGVGPTAVVSIVVGLVFGPVLGVGPLVGLTIVGLGAAPTAAGFRPSRVFSGGAILAVAPTDHVVWSWAKEATFLDFRSRGLVVLRRSVIG